MPVYKIADKLINVVPHSPEITRIFCDYAVEASEYDFDASVSETEIDAENDGTQPQISRYSLEALAIYRKLCEHLYPYDAFMMHSAVISIDNEAFAFAARSGTGKSTHIRLWAKVFGKKVIPVNGDKPIIRLIDGTFYACGTPWAGKERWNTNIMVPLKGICFLERGEQNEINRIPDNDAGLRILNQIYMPSDKKARLKTFELTDEMLKKVPSYLLKCTISEEAATIAYEAMRGKK